MELADTPAMWGCAIRGFALGVLLAPLAIPTGCGQTLESSPAPGQDAGADVRVDENAGADGQADANMADHHVTRPCWQPDPKVPTTPAEQACDRLAAAACERMDHCMPGEWHSFYPLLPHLNQEVCRERLAIGCAEQLALAGSPPPSALENCADQLPAVDCDDIYAAERFGAFQRPLTYDAALELCGVRGSRVDGAACDGSIQCASGYCERLDSDCGKCVRLPVRDEPCSYLCEIGLRCVTEDRDSGDPTCQPLAGEGEPCPSTGHVPESLGCRPGLQCVGGTCQPAAGEDEICGTGSGEGPPYCELFKGFSCYPVDYVDEWHPAPKDWRCRVVPPQPLQCHTPDDSDCVPRKGEDPRPCYGSCLYPAQEEGSRCVLPRVRCVD